MAARDERPEDGCGGARPDRFADLVAGAVGAVGFVLVTPSQFEATAIVQPATVGMPTTTTTTRGAEVEPVAQTLERLKLPTFFR